MNRNPRITCLLCVLLLFDLLYVQKADAQSGTAGVTDSSFHDRLLTQAIQVYTRSPAARDRLYNGTLYPGYDRNGQGFPFFLSDTLLTGSVEYDGIFYPEVPLSYDIVIDMVIMPDARRTFQFQLIAEKLRYFDVAQHHFLYLAPDSNAIRAPTAGFYEELYHGKATALARHIKKVQSIGRADENLFRYRQYDYYFLEVKGRYYPIHSEGDLLDAFGTDRNRVRDFIKKSRLRFKRDPESTLIKTTEYYSQTNN